VPVIRDRRAVLLEASVFAVCLFVLIARVPHFEHFLVNNDHGYQLAAGAELLRGRLPGVDSMSHQGPLIAVLAAMTLGATGNLVGEALFCATAWAATICLAFALTRRHFGLLAGSCTGIASLLCIPRFHKWYVWFVPLAVIAAINRSSEVPTSRRWGLVGVVCGFAALLRPELGLVALGVAAAIALAEELADRGRSLPSALPALGLGFLSLPATWGLVVLTVAGPAALVRALQIVPVSFSGPLGSWSLPPPPFDPADPLSAQSAHALALKLLPGVEILAIVGGSWVAHTARGRPLARQGRALAAIGLMGFALYPQAAYRADIHHLWQGLWPLLAAVPAMCAVSLRFARFRAESGGSAIGSRFGAAGAFLLAAAAVVILTPLAMRPHYDLTPIRGASLSGLAELQRGLAAVPNHPYARIVAAIDRSTKPTDEVLIIPNAPQLLVFANRPASGLCFTYLRGVFDSPTWRSLQLARLEQKPPALVVATQRFFAMTPDEGFRASQPEMYDFLRARYRPITVEEGSGVLLLTPADSPEAR
jgi:hypothetical protein